MRALEEPPEMHGPASEGDEEPLPVMAAEGHEAMRRVLLTCRDDISHIARIFGVPDDAYAVEFRDELNGKLDRLRDFQLQREEC